MPQHVKTLGVMALALILAGCGGQSSVSPEPSQGGNATNGVHYDLQFVTKDGVKQDVGDWSGVELPKPAAGGLIILPGVCNNPQFKVESVAGTRWKTTKSDTEDASACPEDALVVKQMAIDAFSGDLQIRATEAGTTVSNGPYVVKLTAG